MDSLHSASSQRHAALERLKEGSTILPPIPKQEGDPNQNQRWKKTLPEHVPQIVSGCLEQEQVDAELDRESEAISVASK